MYHFTKKINELGFIPYTSDNLILWFSFCCPTHLIAVLLLRVSGGLWLWEGSMGLEGSMVPSSKYGAYRPMWAQKTGELWDWTRYYLQQAETHIFFSIYIGIIDNIFLVVYSIYSASSGQNLGNALAALATFNWSDKDIYELLSRLGNGNAATALAM